MGNEVRLIDANALIANKDLHINIGAGDNICIDIADIAKAPTIDPEDLRPKGRWEKHKNIHGFVYCSNCRDVYLDAEWLADGKWTFCPNCGAKMDLKGTVKK